jgi:glycosyltransferase involved in cell wall biosynthesis
MSAAAPTISIIISTYNAPEWLQKVILGFAYQQQKHFELIIADDGSTPETRRAIDTLRDETGLNIIHVWHEDDGFQKTKILNKAILASSGDYLIFSDGDCIPRKDFVSTHMKHAEQGYFLSGGYFKLPMQTSKTISHEQIKNGQAFELPWLLANGLNNNFKTRKLTAQGWQQKLLNQLTPTGATWNGHNASGWRTDILAANGFDERMQYGGEDRELGERLFNKGIKSKQIRYSAIVIHLDHERGYVKPEMKITNKQIRQQTKQQRSTYSIYGIRKGASQSS